MITVGTAVWRVLRRRYAVTWHALGTGPAAVAHIENRSCERANGHTLWDERQVRTSPQRLRIAD